MKTYATVLFAALLSIASLSAQSLGDAAREARKNKPAKTSTRVYDNSNLPASGTISVVGDSPVPSKPATDGKSGGTASGDGLAPLSQTELAEDWRKRIAEQRRKVATLEEQILPIEKEYRKLEGECAWKKCRVFAGVVSGTGAPGSPVGGTAYSETPEDRAYFAAKERFESTRKQLDEAKAKLDSMVEQSNRETGRR